MRRLLILLDSIKFQHSIFALPFALAALWTAAGGMPSWGVLGLVVVCMVSARSAAMAFNRWADRDFDARNPRTEKRPTVTGAVSPMFLIIFILVNVAVFQTAAYFLNWTCFIFGPLVLAVLLLYSLSKRITSLCHLWLGLSLGLAPVGAHVAVSGALEPLLFPGGWNIGATELGIELFPVLLGAAVMFWTAGFDIIYSCQDFGIDSKEDRLHSIPKRLGIAKALLISKLFHVFASLLFLLAGLHAGLGYWYFGILGLIVVVLIVEHLLVKPNDLRHVNVAFFTFNGVISILFFGGILLETYAS